MSNRFVAYLQTAIVTAGDNSGLVVEVRQADTVGQEVADYSDVTSEYLVTQTNEQPADADDWGSAPILQELPAVGSRSQFRIGLDLVPGSIPGADTLVAGREYFLWIRITSETSVYRMVAGAFYAR